MSTVTDQYSMQELFFGKEKMSLLERCPHFRGVLREFNCSLYTIQLVWWFYLTIMMMVALTAGRVVADMNRRE